MRPGTRRPFRPMPADFPKMWPIVGWTGASARWNAHPRNIVAWLEQAGREQLDLARQRHREANRKTERRVRVVYLRGSITGRALVTARFGELSRVRPPTEV